MTDREIPISHTEIPSGSMWKHRRDGRIMVVEQVLAGWLGPMVRMRMRSIGGVYYDRKPGQRRRSEMTVANLFHNFERYG